MQKFHSIWVSSLLLISSYSANALVNIEPDCNVYVNGDVRIHKGTIDITTKEGEKIFIDASNQVFVNTNPLTLTSKQQVDVNTYASSIHTSLPLVVDIATDGVEIANDTVTEVFGEMFGKDDALIVETHDLISQLNSSLENHFYDDDGAFIIQGSDIEIDGWVDSQWETEFEGKVDAIVEKAMGKMLLKLGSLFLSGDDKAAETLARLENFDSDIETVIEQKAELLEEKTQWLCNTLQEADNAENALQSSSVALSNLSILYVR